MPFDVFLLCFDVFLMHFMPFYCIFCHLNTIRYYEGHVRAVAGGRGVPLVGVAVAHFFFFFFNFFF
jgi:hypothetical protein